MKSYAYGLLILVAAATAWYVWRTNPTAAPKPPTSLDEFKRQPGGAYTVDAGDFLLSLVKQGKLPGFAAGDHGSMHAGIIDGNGNTPQETAPEHFPVSRTVVFSKRGDTSAYFYIVERASAGSPWQLKKAWRIDAEGRIAEQYPVP